VGSRNQLKEIIASAGHAPFHPVLFMLGSRSRPPDTPHSRPRLCSEPLLWVLPTGARINRGYRGDLAQNRK
jgi:hypothetical protein